MATIATALLIKYLDNHCTEAEKALVEAYLQQPGSSAVLNQLLEERLEQDMAASTDMPVSEARQQQWAAAVKTRMGRDVTGKPARKWYYLAAAASLLLMAGVFGLLRTRSAAPQPAAMALQQNKAGQLKMIQLSDGSVIYLGAASSLQYPERFAGSTRSITLDGEAYFDIASDPAHPFVIHTGAVTTTVLGTSFKIDAFAGKPVTVAVATGKVRVEAHTNGNAQTLATLTAGNSVSWHAGQAALQSVNAADVAAWHKGRLVFSNQPLQEIATTLERWYDVKIHFNKPQKAKEKVTITLFAAGDLNTTLQTLAAGNNFNYTRKGREVTIH